MGKKVLTVDLDPQGNTTSGLGIEKNELKETVYELLLGECSLEDCIIHLEYNGQDLLPSNVNLAGAEIELIGIENKEYILKENIDEVRGLYDFIIIGLSSFSEYAHHQCADHSGHSAGAHSV